MSDAFGSLFQIAGPESTKDMLMVYEYILNFEFLFSVYMLYSKVHYLEHQF